MKSINSNNVRIIEARWPALAEKLVLNDGEIQVEHVDNSLVINNIQLTSCYDRIAEAQLQIAQVNELSPSVSIYGPALGDTAIELLNRSELRFLKVVILNRAIFLHTLSLIDQSEWLNDPRVELKLAEDCELLDKYFVTSPSELTLAEPAAFKLRDLIEIEINADFNQVQHGEKEALQKCLVNNLSHAKQSKDIRELALPNVDDIYVVAAGPTLEQHINELKGKDKFIISVDASLKYLLANNIVPNIIVSVDYTSFRFFKDINLDLLANTPLVYFPSIDTRVLEYWPGEKYCSYSNTPMFSEYQRNNHKTKLFSAGSVIHPAIDLAIFMHARNIILFGADFAFTNDKSHAGDQSESHILDMDTARHYVTNYLNQQTPTMASLKSFLRDLEVFITKHPKVNFYTASPLSAKIEGVNLWQH